MSAKTLLHVLLLVVICLLGFLSMGYQLVASRLLAPHFGTTLDVWAFLISTFLAAFSIGSILGGWVSNLRPARRTFGLIVLAILAAVGFGIDAIYGKKILIALEESVDDTKLCLLLSCSSLFLLPVVSLSAFPPLCTERIAAGGVGSGLASGLVYGISTIGNIAGVMTTSFVLIPRFGISTLLYLWLAVATAEVLLLAALLSISRREERAAPAKT